MKTIAELQAAREAENRATDFIHSAQILNEGVTFMDKHGIEHDEFPISGDALQRARYYAQQ